MTRFVSWMIFTTLVCGSAFADRRPVTPACPPERWHLVSGPSAESCRSAGECPVSCPSLGASCVDLSTGDFCGQHEFGKEYLCYCPN